MNVLFLAQIGDVRFWHKADMTLKSRLQDPPGQSLREGFAFFVGTGEMIVTGSVNIPSALASTRDIRTKCFSSGSFAGDPSSAEDGFGVPLEGDEASDPPEMFFAMSVLRFSQVLRSARAGKLD